MNGIFVPINVRIKLLNEIEFPLVHTKNENVFPVNGKVNVAVEVEDI